MLEHSNAWVNFAKWVILMREVHPLHDESKEYMEKELRACGFQDLCDMRNVPSVIKYVTSAFETHLRQQALPEFRAVLSKHQPRPGQAYAEGLERPDDSLVSEVESTLHEALKGLCSCVLWHTQVLGAVARAIQDCGSSLPATVIANAAGMQAAYIQALQALLLPTEPFNFFHLLEQYYALKLQQYKELTGVSLDALLQQPPSESGAAPMSPNPDAMAAAHAAAAAAGGGGSVPEAWVATMRDITRGLEQIGLEAQAHEAISAVIHNDLHATLTAIGRNHFDTRVLWPAQTYVFRVAMELLLLLLPSKNSSEDNSAVLTQWSKRLHFFVFDTVGRLYIQHMFDITVDFPDSQPAVEDMCTCLTYTNLHSRFVDSLRTSVKRRLLHAGVATDSILEAYIAAMKVLRSIDSSGNLLEAIAEPIKAYLRSRPDTIRCVVKMLTQDTGDSNGESLLSDMRNCMDTSTLGMDYDDLEGVDNVIAEAASWQPIPVELDNETLASHTSFDIIATLVDIYGDTDFVNEYKRMLANKLLKKSDYHTGFETRTLELLKLRFAESELHHCDVMLKDMQMSRRLNLMLTEPNGLRGMAEAAHIATLHHRLRGVSVLVCSHLFWPRLPSYDINIPANLQDSMKAHAEMFHLLKSPRKLKFQTSLGTVDLELTIGSAVQRFAVSPVLAVIILQFAHAEERTASYLSSACNLPLEVLLRKALFWVQHGALSEARLPSGELMYRRNEVLPDNIAVTDSVIVADPDDEDHAAARPAHRKNTHDMEPYLQVINNILMSGHAVTLERMHKLLTLFCAHLEPKYNKTVDQLLAYLDVLVERGHLKCERSMYSFAQEGGPGKK